MMEILLVTLSGLITIGLSINSLLKSERQEKELKQKQESLTQAQAQIISKQDALITLQERHTRDLKERTNEVIRLQGLLQQKSDNQLIGLDRIKHPIPDKLAIGFTATILTTSSEFDQIVAGMDHARPRGGNQLPMEFSTNNEGIEKINAFKRMQVEITLTFSNGDKKMQATVKPPMRFSGYNVVVPGNNAFLLFVKSREQKSIEWDGLLLETNEIGCNYLSPSLIDFIQSDVSVNFSFFIPATISTGDLTSTAMFHDKDIVELDLQDLRLYHKNFQLDIIQLRKIGKNSFEGKARFKDLMGR